MILKIADMIYIRSSNKMICSGILSIFVLLAITVMNYPLHARVVRIYVMKTEPYTKGTGLRAQSSGQWAKGTGLRAQGKEHNP